MKNKTLKAIVLSLALTFCSSGVNSSLNNLEKYVNERYNHYKVTFQESRVKQQHFNETKDRVLDKYFTKKAVKRLERIPMTWREMEGAAGMATGGLFFGDLYEIYTGHLPGRKVVLDLAVPLDTLYDESVIVHEYMHHAYGFGMINIIYFNWAYKLMTKDPKYCHIAQKIEEEISGGSCYDSILYNEIPIFRDTERCSWLSEEIISGVEVPYYMKMVYKGVLSDEFLKLE